MHGYEINLGLVYGTSPCFQYISLPELFYYCIILYFNESSWFQANFLRGIPNFCFRHRKTEFERPGYVIIRDKRTSCEENGQFGWCFPSFWGSDGGPWGHGWGTWPPGMWMRPEDAVDGFSGKFWAPMT